MLSADRTLQSAVVLFRCSVFIPRACLNDLRTELMVCSCAVAYDYTWTSRTCSFNAWNCVLLCSMCGTNCKVHKGSVYPLCFECDFKYNHINKLGGAGHRYTRLQAFAMVLLRYLLLWVVVQCSLVNYRHFGAYVCPIFKGEMFRKTFWSWRWDQYVARNIIKNHPTLHGNPKEWGSQGQMVQSSI